MQNKKVGVPKTLKENMKDKKEQIDLTFIIVGIVKFIEVAQIAMRTIYGDKRQITDKQQFTLIELGGSVKFARNMLMHYFKVAPSWLNELREQIISEKSFQEDVDVYINSLVPVKSVLITDNIKQEMSNLKSRKQIFGG